MVCLALLSLHPSCPSGVHTPSERALLLLRLSTILSLDRVRRTVANDLIGIESYTVSLEDQTATVIAKPELEYDTVLATIKKTGKKVNSAEVDGAEKTVE